MNESNRKTISEKSNRKTMSEGTARKTMREEPQAKKHLKYERKIERLQAKEEKTEKKRQTAYDKIETKKEIRFGYHTKEVETEQGKYSQLKYGVYRNERKLRKGERTLSQKLQYQTIHQSKELLKSVWENTEQLEGNEGIEIAHSIETFSKNKIVKPYVRDHFGFDKYKVQEEKLSRQRDKLQAKKEINEEYSKQTFSSNPLSMMYQKRKIKRAVYQEKGLTQSLPDRIKQAASDIYKFWDPFYKVKQAWHFITTVVGAAGAILGTLFNASVFIFIIVIPVIAFVSIFSIFFGFGENPNVEIAKISSHWNQMLSDKRFELIKADEQEWYSKSLYNPVDEVRIEGSLEIDVAKERQRQVQVIGYVSSMLHDELSESLAKQLLDEAFEKLYTVNQRIANEGWWEEKIVGYTPITPVYQDGKLIGYQGGDPIIQEVFHDYWVLYLSLDQGDIDEYALNQINSLADENDRELKNLQYEQYQLGYGFGQIAKSPFDPSFDWRDYVSSLYGYRIIENKVELHNGLDIAVPVGTPLYAIADGTVLDTGTDETEGIYVYYEIDLGDTKYTVKYLHMDSYVVRNREKVKQGQLIGYSGNTGRSTGAHLHLQIEHKGKKCNPLFLIEFPIE